MGSHGRASPEAAATVVTSQINMETRGTTLLLIAVLVTCLARVTQSSCPFEGKEICEGAVTRELSTVVKICENGKLTLKKKSDIAPGWPKAGGECVWYGEILCDGAVVEDLYRWWFLSKCSKGRMSVTSRSWSEVTSDPRYKNRNNNNNNRP